VNDEYESLTGKTLPVTQDDERLWRENKRGKKEASMSSLIDGSKRENFTEKLSNPKKGKGI
jgi:hypothetical protein